MRKIKFYDPVGKEIKWPHFFMWLFVALICLLILSNAVKSEAAEYIPEEEIQEDEEVEEIIDEDDEVFEENILSFEDVQEVPQENDVLEETEPFFQLLSLSPPSNIQGTLIQPTLVNYSINNSQIVKAAYNMYSFPVISGHTYVIFHSRESVRVGTVLSISANVSVVDYNSFLLSGESITSTIDGFCLFGRANNSDQDFEFYVYDVTSSGGDDPDNPGTDDPDNPGTDDPVNPPYPSSEHSLDDIYEIMAATNDITVYETEAEFMAAEHNLSFYQTMVLRYLKELVTAVCCVCGLLLIILFTGRRKKD